MADKMNHDKNPGVFLSNAGLMFEINRTLLHPIGRALATDENGDVSMLYTDDSEGIVYEADDFTRASKKLQIFMEQEAEERFASRENELGFIVQEFADPDIFKEGTVSFETYDWEAETQEGEEPPAFTYTMKADDAQELTALVFAQRLDTFMKEAGPMETGRLYELARRTNALLEED